MLSTKKHDNISWDLYYTSFTRPNLFDKQKVWPSLLNPAKSQYLTWNSYNLGYGTYYHWNIGEKLMIKTGGMFDLYGAMKQAGPDGVNNAMTIEGQMMLKAHAAIKYGWDFKKWALDLHASVTVPVVGLITADHPSEPVLSMLVNNDHSVLKHTYRHVFLGSYHNYMSLDYEAGIDFVVRNGKGYDDLSEPSALYIVPSQDASWTDIKTMVLTNRNVYSTANMFACYMKQVPNATLVGGITGGGGGLPCTYYLPNGWAVTMSAQRMSLDVDKVHIERGIEPDIKVTITEEDINNKVDSILERAVAELSK